MAVRRTRKDKIQAQVRRQETISYSFDTVEQVSQSDNKKKQMDKIIDGSLLLNDPKLIIKDLQKTALVSVLILGLLLASYSWLR